MPIKGLIFISLFAFCSVGAIFSPHLGIYGYLAEYCIGPSRQWWEAPFSGLGLRYSFLLAISTALGIFLNRDKLQLGGHFLIRQEFLLLLFVALVWASGFWGEETIGRYSTTDHPTIKISKVAFFILMMTHVITDSRKFSGLLWVFVIVALILGIQAYSLPRRAFVQGRLEGIGGNDFSEANYLGAFLAAMLPFIGVQLLRSKWYGKLFCASAAAFTANALVLCRSRGAFLGVGVGAITACFFAPKRHRKRIAFGLILGLLGGIYVADPQFLTRVATITRSEETRDESAQSRIRLWQAGLKMASDYPLGVGAGNWYQNIDRYIPEYGGKDSHSTYIKCIAELGFHGLLVFLCLTVNALFTLRAATKKTCSPLEKQDIDMFAFASTVGIAIYLTCCITMTLIYNDFLWILLLLPACLLRLSNNTINAVNTKHNILT